MTQTVDLTNVREFLTRHLIDVFDTMLSLHVNPAQKTDLPQEGERVSGSVGFAGETVNGVIYLHLSANFAKELTAKMLGLPMEEITGETEVNDVIGEMTNMLTGGLKSWMCDVGAECAVSTPAIIRGAAFSIEPMPDVERGWLLFDRHGQRVTVEIHIKLN